MTKLETLKSLVGERVYFTIPIIAVGKGTVDSGTLLSVESPMAVVEWDGCICLDAHDSTVRCKAPLVERISMFLISATPPVIQPADLELVGT